MKISPCSEWAQGCLVRPIEYPPTVPCFSDKGVERLQEWMHHRQVVLCQIIYVGWYADYTRRLVQTYPLKDMHDLGPFNGILTPWKRRACCIWI